MLSVAHAWPGMLEKWQSVLKCVKKQRPNKEKEQWTSWVNRYQSKEKTKKTKPKPKLTKKKQPNITKTKHQKTQNKTKPINQSKQNKSPELFSSQIKLHSCSRRTRLLRLKQQVEDHHTITLENAMKDFSLSGTLVFLICDYTHLCNFIKERKSIILIATLWLYEIHCNDFTTACRTQFLW